MKRIGIDIGTSTICAVLYDTESNGTTSLSKTNDSWLDSTKPWERIQDADRIVELVQQLIDQLNTPENQVEGIGFTGQMHGIVYLDREGRAVSPLYTWQDGRAGLTYKDGKSYAAWMSELTGYEMSAGYGLATHFYNQLNGLLPATAVRMCTIMDYAAMHMAGIQTPLIDPSNAASLGLFDKKRLQFDEKQLQLLDIAPSWLPAVTPCVAQVGQMDNIPVYTAVGDNQAAFIGSMKGNREAVFITIGTSAQMSVWTKEYVEVDTLDTRPLPGGGYILVGAALCGGSVLATMKDFLSDIVFKLTSVQVDSETIYAFMAQAAGQVIDNTLKADTRFNGSRQDVHRKGAITGITPQNFRIENLVQAFYQGIAQEMYDFYEKLPAQIREGKIGLVGAGNALKKNLPLQHCLVQLFGYPLSLSDCEEDAALGAALCMTASCGAF